MNMAPLVARALRELAVLACATHIATVGARFQVQGARVNGWTLSKLAVPVALAPDLGAIRACKGVYGASSSRAAVKFAIRSTSADCGTIRADSKI